MHQKFPFGDTVLKNLGVLEPEKTASYPVSTIIGLGKRFPHFGLSDSTSLDQLREKFLDLTMSPSDLPIPGEYHAADGTVKPKTGFFWSGKFIIANKLCGAIQTIYRNLNYVLRKKL